MKIITVLLLVVVLCAIGGEAGKGKARGRMQQSYSGGGQRSYGGGQQHSSGGSPMQHRAPMRGQSKGKGQQQPMNYGRPMAAAAARPMMSPSYGGSGSAARPQMSGSYGSSAPRMTMPAQQSKPSAQSSYGGGNTGGIAAARPAAPMSSAY